MKLKGVSKGLKILKAVGVWFLSLIIITLVVVVLFPGDTVVDADGVERVSIAGWRFYVCFVVPFAITALYCLRRKKKKLTFRRAEDLPVEPVLSPSSRTSPLPEDDTHRLMTAAAVCFETGQASSSILERRFGIDYAQASFLLHRLEELGIVSPFTDTSPRSFLKTWEQSRDIIANSAGQLQHTAPFSHVPPEMCGVSSVDQEMLRVDMMEGHAFEYWCADVLRGNGFTSVEVTRGSGDQGVDVLAEKGGLRYAIQCKCYAHPLGNTPVQEIHAGKDMYGCHVAVVMTNNHFTPGGKELAAATRVLLWDREEIMRMWENANK